MKNCKIYLPAIFIAAVLGIAHLAGCKANENVAVPHACINSVVSPQVVGSSHNYTSCSTGGSAYLWDFGDGTNASVANTTHSYNAVGNYLVTLTVTGSGRSTSVDTVNVTVTN